MMKKTTSYMFVGLVGILVIAAGMLYANFSMKSSGPATDLQSQFLATDEVVTNTTPVLSREKIEIRISQIEQELLQETNDPDRAIELRRELQRLRDQLK